MNKNFWLNFLKISSVLICIVFLPLYSHAMTEPSKYMTLLQQEFNRAFLNSLNAYMQTNQFIGWNNGGFLKGIFGICFIWAMAEALANPSPNGMLLEIMALAFYSWLIVALIGGPTYTPMRVFQVPDPRYQGRSQSLDVDIFNFVAYKADNLGNAFFTAGILTSSVEAAQQNENMMKNMNNASRICEDGETACYKAFFPADRSYVDPDKAYKNRKLKSFVESIDIISPLASATTWIMLNGLSIIYSFVSFLVNLITGALNFFLLILFGISSGIAFFLTKLLFPFALIKRFRGRIWNITENLFAIALFNLTSSIIVFLSAAIYVSMNNAVFDIIYQHVATQKAPSFKNPIAQVAASVGSGVGNAAALGSLMFALFTIMLGGIIILAIFQIQATLKIPQITKDLVRISLDTILKTATDLFSPGGVLSIAMMAMGAGLLSGLSSMLGGLMGGATSAVKGMVGGAVSGGTAGKGGILGRIGSLAGGGGKSGGSSKGAFGATSKRSVPQVSNSSIAEKTSAASDVRNSSSGDVALAMTNKQAGSDNSVMPAKKGSSSAEAKKELESSKEGISEIQDKVKNGEKLTDEEQKKLDKYEDSKAKYEQEKNNENDSELQDKTKDSPFGFNMGTGSLLVKAIWNEATGQGPGLTSLLTNGMKASGDRARSSMERFGNNSFGRRQVGTKKDENGNTVAVYETNAEMQNRNFNQAQQTVLAARGRTNQMADKANREVNQILSSTANKNFSEEDKKEISSILENKELSDNQRADMLFKLRQGKNMDSLDNPIDNELKTKMNESLKLQVEQSIKNIETGKDSEKDRENVFRAKASMGNDFSDMIDNSDVSKSKTYTQYQQQVKSQQDSIKSYLTNSSDNQILNTAQGREQISQLKSMQEAGLIDNNSVDGKALDSRLQTLSDGYHDKEQEEFRQEVDKEVESISKQKDSKEEVEAKRVLNDSKSTIDQRRKADELLKQKQNEKMAKIRELAQIDSDYVSNSIEDYEDNNNYNRASATNGTNALNNLKEEYRATNDRVKKQILLEQQIEKLRQERDDKLVKLEDKYNTTAKPRQNIEKKLTDQEKVLGYKIKRAEKVVSDLKDKYKVLESSGNPGTDDEKQKVLDEIKDAEVKLKKLESDSQNKNSLAQRTRKGADDINKDFEKKSTELIEHYEVEIKKLIDKFEKENP